jgi:hypothetical protein
MKRYEDASDPLNDERFHTGKPCIEPGCTDPAGTAWSLHWCQKHNAERMNRISDGMKTISERFRGK